MTRSRVISALLGLVLIACAVVIVMDQQGLFGNAPFPWGSGSSGQNSDYNLPPSTPNSGATDPSAATPTPTPSTPADSTTEIQPTPAAPPAQNNSGYGDLK